MNIKPGDIAIIVSATGATANLIGDVSRAAIGLIGRVTHMGLPENPRHCITTWVWKFEKPMTVRVRGAEYEILGCSDFDLRPIRNPGDDAKDESLAWLPPVPTITPEEVTAC